MLGRPTKYTPKILAMAREYVAGGYRDAEDDHNREVIPSIAGLSVRLGIARSTIYDWASHEDKLVFSDILDEIQSKQESLLINQGLTGAFNSAIAKLALGKHGYSEKTDNAHHGADDGPIEVTTIERIIVKA